MYLKSFFTWQSWISIFASNTILSWKSRFPFRTPLTFCPFKKLENKSLFEDYIYAFVMFTSMYLSVLTDTQST